MEWSFELGAAAVTGVLYIASMGALFWRTMNIEKNMDNMASKQDKLENDVFKAQLDAARDYATKSDVRRLEDQVAQLGRDIADLPQKVADLLKK